MTTTITRRAVLGAASGAAAAVAFPSIVRSQQKIATITVASPIDDAITPFLYAQHSGAFERYGLDVKLQIFPSGPALTAAVVGGAINIGKAALFPLTEAHARNVPIKLIAGAALYDYRTPAIALLVAKDSPIRTAADLQGKSVASSALQSIDAIATRAWIDTHGGNSALVNFGEMPMPAMVPALEQGRYDAVSPANPMLQRALDSGKVRPLAWIYDAIAKHFLIAGWFCTESYIEQNRDVIRRFARAIYEAAAYVNGHHAETVEMVSAFTHIPAEVIRHMNRVPNATSLDPEAISPTIAIQVKYGLLPRPFPPEEMIADLR